MHVIFLLTQDLERPSGLGRYWPLARQLARLGHRVEIAALHSNWRELKVKAFERDGVAISYVAQMHIRRLGDRQRYMGAVELVWVTAQAAAALTRAAVRSQADIIHVAKAQPMNGLAGWLAARLRPSRRLYLDCDDYEALSNHFAGGWQKSIVRWWEDRLPRAARATTVNTHFSYDRCRGLGVPADRLLLVPNGFDPDRFDLGGAGPDPQAYSRQRLGRQRLGRQRLGFDGEPVVLYMGTLNFASHPVWLLLDAFEEVRRRLPAARLWLVGGGYDFDRLSATIAERGLGQSVIQSGRIDPSEARFAYAASTVTVDPVLADDVARARSPLKIVESMACGVPVVTGDVGDRAAMLGNGAAGVLVAPGRADALADGLVRVLSDEAWRRQLGQQALSASQSYRWDRLAATFSTVYQI